MRKVKLIIAFALFIVILASSLIFSFLSRHVVPNPEDAVGNTAGNLFNGGYFCEDGERVYFANAYDNYTLYSMNPDGSDVKKLSNSIVSSLNCAGKYLFFYQANSLGSTGYGSLFRINGLYRIQKDGKRSTCLQKCNVPGLSVYGNTIFYQLYDTKIGTNLYRIDINKKNNQQIGDGAINPSCIANGNIYYGGFDKEHNLHAINLQSNQDNVIAHGEFYMPQIEGSYVYYMDIHKNYHLYRMDLGSGQVQELTKDRLDSFNIYNGIIYYQKSSSKEPALMRCNNDGSNPEKVMDGVYENINITDRYVYFNQFDTPAPVYHQSTFGNISPSVFNTPIEKPGFFEKIVAKFKK